MNNLLIGDFEGPLDLLLHLIKKDKKDILDINIFDITEQYLNYINTMEQLNLDVASEYLVTAAELIEIKSRKLLPKFNDDDNSEDDYVSEEELKRRLLEYEQYKNSKSMFIGLAKERKKYLTKAPENMNLYSNVKVVNDGSICAQDLLKSLEELINRRFHNKPMTTKVTSREISIKDKILKIRDLFKKHKKIEFLNCFGSEDKENVVVSFLSILEMAKNKELSLWQKDNFGEIYLERVDNNEI